MQPPQGPASARDRASDMATLLDESAEYRTPQRGDIVEGVVMGWDRDGALVDIGAKSEGVIPKHELQSLGPDVVSQLKSGDKILVFVMQPETQDGQITLSLDRARGERGWHTLQERFESGEVFEATVSGYNKGGLLVNVEGVNAFVPLSQVVGVRPDRGREDGGSNLGEAVGKTLRLKVIEINRRRNRVILSERAALQEWRTAQKERLIQELREGDIRRGRISSVRSFGVFVDLGGADGLAHLSELTWDRDKTPQELFNVGDEVDVYVTKIDPENKKIALSLRRANPEQWDAIVDKYQEGRVVTGVVTKLVPFGAFARIEGPVEGLIHVSELVDRRIGHPKEVAREGDILPLKILRIERDRHRLGLSLRRARDEGEAMGFVFTEGGEVLSVPEDLRREIVEREGPLPTPPEEREESAPAGESAPADMPVAEAPDTATAEATEDHVTTEDQPEASVTSEPGAPATVAEQTVEAEAEPAEPPAVAAEVREEPGAPSPTADEVATEPAEAEEPAAGEQREEPPPELRAEAGTAEETEEPVAERTEEGPPAAAAENGVETPEEAPQREEEQQRASS